MPRVQLGVLNFCRRVFLFSVVLLDKTAEYVISEERVPAADTPGTAIAGSGDGTGEGNANELYRDPGVSCVLFACLRCPWLISEAS